MNMRRWRLANVYAVCLCCWAALLLSAGRAALAEGGETPATLIERSARAVRGVRSLRATFTQEEYDPMFEETEKKRGEILALRRPDKPDLARISFLQALVGQTYRDRVRHFWAEDDRLVDYNPRAAVAKVYDRPEETSVENPANAQETALIYLSHPERLLELYEARFETTANPPGDNLRGLVFTPRETPDDAPRPRLRKMTLWIDTTTFLPRRCVAEKPAGEIDTLHIDTLELDAKLEPRDIAVDLPAGVQTIREGAQPR